MPLYDLMLLLDPGAPSDRHQTILSDVQSMLESGGTFVGAHDWGTRRMTFEIDHRPDAAYHLFQFETEAGGALLERVDHSLKIMDGVLRHRIIRLKDGSPPPPMPRPEGRSYGEGVAGEGAPADAAPAAAPPADAAPAAAPPADAAPAADVAPAPAAADAAPAPDTATPGDVAAAPSEASADAPAPEPTQPAAADADQEPGAAGPGDDDEAPSGGAAA